MILSGLKPIIWSPSFKFLELQSKSETFLTPNLLLKLVDAGIIKIAAREEWLRDKQLRNKKKEKWKFAEWTQYDNDLLKFLVRIAKS